MSDDLKILMLEDSEADAELALYELRKGDIKFSVNRVWTEADFLAGLREIRLDLILADYTIPGYDGLAALAAAHRERPEVPVIFVSGNRGEEIAVEALHSGAADWVSKQGLWRLVHSVQRALREAAEHAERQRAEQALRTSREELQTITDTLPVLIAYTDRNRVYRFVNAAHEQWYGLPRERILNRSVAEIVGQEAAARNWPYVQRVLAGETVVFEHAVPMPQGLSRYFTYTLIPRRSAHGEVEGYYTLAADITSRKQIEEALRENEQRYRSLFENMLNGLAFCRMIYEDDKPTDFVYLVANNAFHTLTGLKDVVGRKVSEVIPGFPQTNPEVIEACGRVSQTGKPERFETFVAPLKKRFAVTAYSPQRDHFVAIFDDATERRRIQQERETTIEFLRLVNESASTRDLIRKAVTFFQQQSGCEAAGVRLCEGEDYPYYEARGFPPEFVQAENQLCERDNHGELLRDDLGNPCLSCMCGNVIRGRFDPSKPFFTAHGSFWTNSTSDLLASTTEAERQARTRNRCHAEGYESVALLPLRVGEQRLGLLQLNDRHRDRFTLEIIGLWERLADHLAVALAKFHADEALQEREEHYRLLADNADDFVSLTDVHGNRLYRSPSYYRVTGWTPEEVHHTDPTTRLHPDDVARVQQAHAANLAGQPTTIEHRIRCRDGSWIWVEARCKPILGPDGNVCQLLLWSRDISEQRKALDALRESEQRFRQFAENIREVFWLAEPGTGQMLYASPAYETIWGRRPDNLYQSPLVWLDAVHPDDRDRVFRAILTETINGHYDQQYRIIRPDGDVRWIRDRAFPVHDAGGRVVRIAGVAEDITERTHLESQLRQSQKMEAFGQLAGGVAHDFNNLLTVICGRSERLIRKLPAHDPIREAITEIRQAGQQAAVLTRQLLAFSRQQVLEPRIVHLNTIIADLEKMLRRLIGEDIKVATVLAPDLARVKVDPGQITQVIMNVVVNARDAMPKGGRLTIETQNAILDEPYARRHPDIAPGFYVLLAITDTGCGIPPEVQAHIFDPFFTTKGGTHGTGLGLAVVHGIIQQSGGHISVYSEVGVGTTFKIYLPAIVEATAETPRPDAVPVLAGGKEKLLLVEDDAEVRLFISSALQDLGYTVTEATNGIEALRMLAGNGPVDLLVTDVVMPEMGGRELVEASHLYQPNLKVLYLSGYTNDAIVRHGILHAEVAFLQKPFTVDELATKVRQVLDKS